MLLQIPDVLTPEHLVQINKALDEASWIDGRATAGYRSSRVKDNRQLPETDPVAIGLGDLVLQCLERNPTFLTAALPHRVVPPLFNRYAGGEQYGNHVDGAIRPLPNSPIRVRADLSATVFLSDPASYDGGELVVSTTYGEHRVKLPAGYMVLYSGGSLHRVEPVTRGTRTACFFWIQSMVRDDACRDMLHDLDQSIRAIASESPDHPQATKLLHLYHNLLRMWADA